MSRESIGYVPIIICSYGRSKILYDSLTSLRESINNQENKKGLPRMRVILVDNGSGEETRSVINAFRDILDDIVLLKENKGKPNAWNLGISMCYNLCTKVGEIVPNYFILCDSDVGFSSTWFAELYKTFVASERHEHFKGKLALMSGFQNIVGKHKIKLVEVDGRTVQERRYPPGCCWIMARRAFETLGLFDSDLLIRGIDTAYCKKAWAAGWSCAVITPTVVSHLGADHRTWDLTSGKSIYFP